MPEQTPTGNTTNKYLVWFIAGVFVFVVIPLLAIFGAGVVTVMFTFVSRLITGVIVVIARFFGYKTAVHDTWGEHVISSLTELLSSVG